MWTTFVLGIALGVLSIYIPGYLFSRVLRLGHYPSLVVAPLVSLVVFNLLAILYKVAGVVCSFATVVLPGAVAAVIVLAAGRFIRKKTPIRFNWVFDGDAVISGLRIKHFDAIAMLAYVAIGCAVTTYVLVASLDGPSSYVQEFDNVHHLDMIKNFAESGEWSLFSTDYYLDAEQSPFISSGGGFYPSSWLMIAALIYDTVGSQPALAENAANFVFVAFVLPMSMYGLMRSVFRNRPLIVLCGAICVFAFIAFPWQLLTFGPIYPNLAAYAMVPSVATCFMCLFAKDATLPSRVLAVCMTAVGLAALAFTQPNAVFTTVVFLLPFCMYRTALAVDFLSFKGRKRIAAKIAVAIGFFVFAAVIWAVMLHLPFFQGVLSEWWPKYTGGFQAIADVITLRFVGGVWQPLLAFAVVLGAVYALLRREYLWLVFAYMLFCLMFVLDAATESDLKLWLTGFWYTDKYRIAAAAALFGAPLASMGLHALCSASRKLVHSVLRGKDSFAPAAVSVFVLAVFASINYYPSVMLSGQQVSLSAFGSFKSQYEMANSANETRPYTKAEQTFVERVSEVVSESELILNVPHDGSAFAYSQNDLNIYYRSPRGYEPNIEEPESALVRNSLCDIASDSRVYDAVNKIGAKYVLLLAVDKTVDTEPYLFTYEEENWEGMSTINDSTPGFEAVLSEGDMRLYRIEGIA